VFVWLIGHQPVVLFSQNKSAINNQPTVLFSQNKSAINNQPTILFSQNKSAPTTSHQPTEQADNTCLRMHHASSSTRLQVVLPTTPTSNGASPNPQTF
jgi:hypothetical protein